MLIFLLGLSASGLLIEGLWSSEGSIDKLKCHERVSEFKNPARDGTRALEGIDDEILVET